MMKNFNLERMIKLMLLTMLLALVSPAVTNIVYAETDSQSKETEVNHPENLKKSFDKMQSIASQSHEVMNPIVIETTKNSTLNAIKEKKIILNGQNVNLLWNNSKFLSIDKEDANYKSISVPIEGKKYSFFSNLTVVFDKNENVVTYSESLITKNQVNKFVIDTYIEGKKVSTKNTDIDYINNSKLKEGLFSLKQSVKESKNENSRGIGAVAGCIAAIAGINGTVAYLIAGTCIAACPAVAPICAACIAGVCTIRAADIGGVIACFKL